MKTCPLEKEERLLMQVKMVESFALSGIKDKEIYRTLMHMWDNPNFLRTLHYKLLFTF